MSNYTNGQTERLPHGKIYKVLTMQKKTGNNLICKNCSNLQLFKSHILVGANSQTKYNLINIFLLYSQNQELHSQKKKKKNPSKKRTLQSTRLKPWATISESTEFLKKLMNFSYKDKNWDLVCFSSSTNGLCWSTTQLLNCTYRLCNKFTNN